MFTMFVIAQPRAYDDVAATDNFTLRSLDADEDLI